MNFNKFKRAFSLTELLIVLVIVAVLFAALAPIMTKRFNGSESNVESVWRFTDGNTHDAYYDSEVPTLTSAAFVGLTTDGIKKVYNEKHYSKLILRAVENQDFIHFRYGDGDGIYTGSFIFDNNGNLKTVGKVSYTGVGENNTAAGIKAFNNYNTPKENVAIGARAMAADLATSSGEYSSNGNVAVGSNSGEYISGNNNTFLGANTGRTESKGAIENTVAIGANVLNHATSKGKNNVFAGAGVMSAGLTTASNDNVVLGSRYYAENSQNNTIIGYDVYTGKTNTQSNLTAVGYDSCMSVSDFGKGTTNTCIGYGSAKNKGVYSGMPYEGGTAGFDVDNGDHIYLGGAPKGFGGRSVLEVHNFSSNYGPTVVMNSNLVVRGNLFFPAAVTHDGKLSSHTVSTITDRKSGSEKGRDECCTKPFHRRHWHSSSCSIWNIIIGVIIGAAAIVGGFISLGATTALAIAYAAVYGATLGGTVGSLFGGKGYDRAPDPLSFSAMNFTKGGKETEPKFAPACVDSKNENYPKSDGACPDLQLSDIRLKENISENTEALEKIMLIMPYNYTFKNDVKNLPQVSVIAQDLQLYFPNAVSSDNKGFLQIRRDELFYVTVNSIKSLNNKMTDLSNDINNLENDSTTIVKEQKSIQKRVELLNKRINKLEK